MKPLSKIEQTVLALMQERAIDGIVADPEVAIAAKKEGIDLDQYTSAAFSLKSKGYVRFEEDIWELNEVGSEAD